MKRNRESDKQTRREIEKPTNKQEEKQKNKQEEEQKNQQTYKKINGETDTQRREIEICSNRAKKELLTEFYSRK